MIHGGDFYGFEQMGKLDLKASDKLFRFDSNFWIKLQLLFSNTKIYNKLKM